jgi:hypothetical protein
VGTAGLGRPARGRRGTRKGPLLKKALVTGITGKDGSCL